MLKYKNKDKIGVRSKFFDYSGKILLSIKDYKEKIQSEINRVKKLKNNKFWIEENSNESDFYTNDVIKSKKKGSNDMLKGIGESSIK